MKKAAKEETPLMKRLTTLTLLGKQARSSPLIDAATKKEVQAKFRNGSSEALRFGKLQKLVKTADRARAARRKAEATALVSGKPVKSLPPDSQLEALDPNPDQTSLNIQLALTRLVNSPEEQNLARTDGVAFQRKYNLNNDQMWTLCRIALEVGFYQDTNDLHEYLRLFNGMDDELKYLSPDAAEALDLQGPESGIVGSCSCCCP